ncbi:MAG: glycoside hydrolase family 2 protein [Promethearchaeota archaeon]
MEEQKKYKWRPIEGQLMSRWAKKILLEKPFLKYPRPQLKRKEWKSLNGLWNYAIRPIKEKIVNSYDGKILVPFAVESALSGVKKKLKPNQKLWYQCNFNIPESWSKKKILLHFGAVDWEATVFVNKRLAGIHKGGYTPFSFDITEFLNEKKNNELIVVVWDPTDKGRIERGKQTLKPYGIKYTAISGIWQTVWLEPVSETYIKSLKMIPNIDEEKLILKVNVVNCKKEDKLRIFIFDKKEEIINIIGGIHTENYLKIPSPKLWYPNSPFLYDLKIQINRNDEIIDEISSYFGMRKISIEKDKHGNKRILLNNEVCFQYGLLDQGYWPGGLYTAPTDEALRNDIEIIKELGFNTIRKHVKVEPARWYYYCDKLGIIVWQDMPNGGKMGLIHTIIGFLKQKKKIEHKRKEEEKKNFYNELESMIDTLFNHPSIIMWIPFNEGWGQFETKKTVEKIKKQDPTRLINNASGWFDQGIGDIRDCHKYIGPEMPNNIKGRAAVCGEFGGLGLKIKGHVWKKKLKFVYKKFQNSQQLTQEYAKLIKKLIFLKKKGLCAAIYTQFTDVEGEINGLLTYDREIIKIDKEKLKKLNLSVYSE